MTTARCKDTAHDFDKFDDATIYCRRCGEQRVMDLQALIAKFPTPIYYPCPGPHYPPVPSYPNPWPTWHPWIITSGTITTGTVQVGNTTYIDNNDDNVTYTVENIS